MFVHDNGQIVLDFEKTGTGAASNSDLAHRYLWGTNVDELLTDEVVDTGSEDDNRWVLTDHLNSVRDLVVYDPVTGTVSVVKHVAYDAYGNVTSDSATGVESLFLFTARPFDMDTDLQNNLNRWYDLSTGRWMSVDPIGFDAGDVNLYRYVGNSPADRMDPRGLQEVVQPLPPTEEPPAFFPPPGGFITQPVEPEWPVFWTKDWGYIWYLGPLFPIENMMTLKYTYTFTYEVPMCCNRIFPEDQGINFGNPFQPKPEPDFGAAQPIYEGLEGALGLFNDMNGGTCFDPKSTAESLTQKALAALKAKASAGPFDPTQPPTFQPGTPGLAVGVNMSMPKLSTEVISNPLDYCQDVLRMSGTIELKMEFVK